MSELRGIKTLSTKFLKRSRISINSSNIAVCSAEAVLEMDRYNDNIPGIVEIFFVVVNLVSYAGKIFGLERKLAHF